MLWQIGPLENDERVRPDAGNADEAIRQPPAPTTRYGSPQEAAE